MNIRKTIITVTTATLILLSLALFVGCDEDDSITIPQSKYILEVGRVEGPSSITLGDTLWITFTDIRMNDSCHIFHELEVEMESSLINFYRLWGKVEGEVCLAAEWNYSHTIAITNFENTGTHHVVIHQPDDSVFSYDVVILMP